MLEIEWNKFFSFTIQHQNKIQKVLHIQKESCTTVLAKYSSYVGAILYKRECCIVLVKNTAFHFFKAFAKMGIRAEHFEQDVAAAYFNYG